VPIPHLLTRYPGHSARSGFTLLELMVCLAILALLSAVAVPSFQRQISSTRAQATARALMSAAMLARASAIRQGTPVTLCPDRADCDGYYDRGFGVYQDSRTPIRVYGVDDGTRIGNRAGSRRASEAITWDGRGIGNRNLTWVVCVSGGDPWAVVLNRVGRPRLERGIGQCLGAT